MTQLLMEFFQPAVENSNSSEPGIPAKETLEQYIKVCGLVAYKDFFMKIKNGLVAIPEGLTRGQYILLAREVYEARAAKVNRTKVSRRQYFAIKNKNKKARG